MRELLRAFVLFAPLLVAAMLSAVVCRFDLWRVLYVPVDMGAKLRGRRVFGDNKTLRGFVVAIVGCVGAVAVEKTLPLPASLCVVDYANANPLLLGSAMGLGAMLGELPNSFVKRRLDISPGEHTDGPRRVVFYLWDQLDLLTGAWPLVSPWARPTPSLVLASVVVVLVLHPCVALIGFLVGARQAAR